MKEIESVCNNGPLNYIYDENVIEPLQPNHLIHVHGRAIVTRCDDIVNMKGAGVSVESLKQRHKYEHFLRWSDEY